MNVAELRERSFKRILLIKPSAVGDVIHTLPVLAKLRARYPEARIDWLLAPHIAELVRHHPALSNVLIFARQDFARAEKKGTVPLRKRDSPLFRTHPARPPPCRRASPTGA